MREKAVEPIEGLVVVHCVLVPDSVLDSGRTQVIEYALGEALTRLVIPG
jgi:hypothetical protein